MDGPWHDDEVDPTFLVIVLAAVAMLMIGIVMAVALAWMRWGRSRAARWWVARPLVDSEFANAPERLVLVVLPLIAQTLIVAGIALPLSGVAAATTASGGLATGILIAACALQLIIWAVVAIPTAHSSVFPLWMYPAWLRQHRAADRERFHQEMAMKRERRRRRRS